MAGVRRHDDPAILTGMSDVTTTVSPRPPVDPAYGPDQDHGLSDAADSLRAVLDVSRALTAIDDETELLELIASSACSSLGYGACVVAVRDETGVFACRATAGCTADEERHLRADPLSSDGFAALCDAATPLGSVLHLPAGHPVRQHPALRTAILRTEPSAPSREWHPGSLLIVPLRDIDGTTIGYLNPDDPLDGRLPGSGQIAVLETFAHLAVVALEVVRGRAAERVRVVEAEQVQRQLAGLLHATATVRGSLQLDEVLQQIALAMASAGGFDGAVIYLHDPATGLLHARAAVGLGAADQERLRTSPVPFEMFRYMMQPEMRISRSYLFDHRYHRVPREVDAALAIPPFASDWQEGQWHPEDSLTIPLEDRHGHHVGIISVDEPYDRGFPSLARIQALEIFADHCAIAVEHAALYREMEVLALTDALTGLPNRTVLRDRLRLSLEGGRDQGPSLALLVLDLDRFKDVNDTLGHYLGDALLVQVAARLRGVMGHGEMVARLGGDEFAALLPNADIAHAEAVAHRIRAAIELPYMVDGESLILGVSVGIALAPEHGTDAATLFQHADVAMYVAKRGSLGQALYAPVHDRSDPERIALVADLRAAIQDGALILHYQPKVAIRTGKVCGVEVLVRWPHPTYGLLPPARFIPLAEQTGLIMPLTTWVIEAALGQCHAWHEAGLIVDVAVNISLSSLRDPDLCSTVERLLRRHAVPPERLCLELTESVIMADVEGTRTVLARLAALGVRLAVDDFGTGYSSLAYLSRLPVQELKIDRSFVQRLASESHDRTIVASTIGLGHSLGLRVVTEGIEDAETWDLLAGLGCDVGQGYYLSRPLPAAEIEAWLRATTPQWSQPPVAHHPDPSDRIR